MYVYSVAVEYTTYKPYCQVDYEKNFEFHVGTIFSFAYSFLYALVCGLTFHLKLHIIELQTKTMVFIRITKSNRKTPTVPFIPKGFSAR